MLTSTKFSIFTAPSSNALLYYRFVLHHHTTYGKSNPVQGHHTALLFYCVTYGLSAIRLIVFALCIVNIYYCGRFFLIPFLSPHNHSTLAHTTITYTEQVHYLKHSSQSTHHNYQLTSLICYYYIQYLQTNYNYNSYPQYINQQIDV